MPLPMAKGGIGRYSETAGQRAFVPFKILFPLFPERSSLPWNPLPSHFGLPFLLTGNTLAF